MKKVFSAVAAVLCGTLLIVLLMAALGAGPFIRLYANVVGKKLGIAIDYSLGPSTLLGTWYLNDVKITTKTGYRLDIERIELRPSFAVLRAGEISFVCRSENLKFHKELPFVNNVRTFLSIPPAEGIRFDAVNGTVSLKKNEVKVGGLEAEHKDMRILAEGTVDTSAESMDYECVFLFSDRLTSNIHDVLKFAILTKDEPGWMRLELNVHGDYKKPSLKLKNDLLDINIKAINLQ